eukprot:gnl/MRDRNA2_/MRDRNA2_123484_c0_seq1.p1 gnl/MRDRNA2_/MRDRNA2_123484_c0~~gnl/MRDRNA2_/MRDRNA2_123484_c0_seq1.p1  ORF type:complete len:647 (+),score=126.92 gnl/MRDRNA2_/MRDRNA2_123484_c0_seq1:70-2010(+)
MELAEEGERAPWFVPRRYKISRKSIIRAMQGLDVRDAPDNVGMLKLSSARQAIEAFDEAFKTQRSTAEKEEILLELVRHTEDESNVFCAPPSLGYSPTTVRTGPTYAKAMRQASIGLQSHQLEQTLVEWERDFFFDAFYVNLNMRERIFFTVDVSEASSAASQFFSVAVMLTIAISILNWMMSTSMAFQEVPCESSIPGECKPQPKMYLVVVEVVCIYIFTMEYLIRICLVHAVRFELLNEIWLEALLAGEEGVKKRVDAPHITTLKFFFEPANLIDFLAISPYWTEMAINKPGEASSLAILRILRLTRVFRVFKLGRYNEMFLLFGRVIQKSLPALYLMIFFLAMALCLFATMVWFTDQGIWYSRGHPELLKIGITTKGAYLRAGLDGQLEETPFPSISSGFWWVVVTVTTVGYGDVYPTTSAGRVVGSIAILVGVITLAMPIGVIGANFSAEYDRALLEGKRRERLKHAKLELLKMAKEEREVQANETQASDSSTNAKRVTMRSISTAQQSLKECTKQGMDLTDKVNELQVTLGLPDAFSSLFTERVEEVIQKLRESEKQPLSMSSKELDPKGGGGFDIKVLDRLLMDMLTMIASLEDPDNFPPEEANFLRLQYMKFVTKCLQIIVPESRGQPTRFSLPARDEM